MFIVRRKLHFFSYSVWGILWRVHSVFTDELYMQVRKKEFGYISELDSYLYYDEYLKESIEDKHTYNLRVFGGRLFFRKDPSAPFGQVMRPSYALKTILMYHIGNKKHKNFSETQKDLKLSFVVIPDIVVEKIISHCSCSKKYF